MGRANLSDRHRQQRVKNYAVLGAILAFSVIMYFVYIIRAGVL